MMCLISFNNCDFESLLYCSKDLNDCTKHKSKKILLSVHKEMLSRCYLYAVYLVCFFAGCYKHLSKKQNKQKTSNSTGKTWNRKYAQKHL